MHIKNLNQNQWKDFLLLQSTKEIPRTSFSNQAVYRDNWGLFGMKFLMAQIAWTGSKQS